MVEIDKFLRSLFLAGCFICLSVSLVYSAPAKKSLEKKRGKLGEHGNSWAVGVTTGFYALDGITNNWHSEINYDYFLDASRFFFEAVVGAGPLITKSKSDLGNATQFDNNYLITYGVQTIIIVGKSRVLNFARPNQFLSVGFAGAYLGGDNAIGLTVGFGSRYPFKVGKTSNLAWRYEVKDQIYTRRINLDTHITHNIYLGAGLQFGVAGL